MNILRTPLFRALAVAAAVPLISLFLAACDVDSADSTTAVVSDNSGTIYSYAGLYMRDSSNSTSGVALVYPEGQQSGTVLTWIRLLQYGSVLEGYDNADQNWSGSISAQNGAVASFTLSGQTSAGNSVEIVGTLSSASSSSSSTTTSNGATSVSATSATMDASWLESGFSGSIFAKATTSPATSNATKELSISPTSASLNSNKVTQVFTASGGAGSFTWTLSSTNYGSLSSSGNQATFTASGDAGTTTITVTDTNGASATATATYSGSSSSSLKISPSATTLTGNDDTVSLTASGGSSPYSWTVSSTTLGSVSATTGSTVTYTSKKVAGTATITVTDDDDNSATATVTYSGSSSSSDLKISPSGTLNFNTNYIIQVFTATGGNDPYTWNVSSTNFGTLSASSGSQVTYTSKFVGGTNYITVTDEDGVKAWTTAIYSTNAP